MILFLTCILIFLQRANRQERVEQPYWSRRQPQVEPARPTAEPLLLYPQQHATLVVGAKYAQPIYADTWRLIQGQFYRFLRFF